MKRVQPLEIDPDKNFASGKTKMATWFVSHCKYSRYRKKYGKLFEFSVTDRVVVIIISNSNSFQSPVEQ